MDSLTNLIMLETGASSAVLAWSILVVGLLICVFGLVGLVVSIWLSIRYIKFNRKKNSVGLTGDQVARRILDMYSLNNIKVSAVGSILFGNSYSHYFKKVRLRRLTYKKASISSLAMAAQKSSLAVLDKEGDSDMLRRNKLIPLISFGPFMFIPLIVIGVLLDMYLAILPEGAFTMILSLFGLAFYIFSFILSITVLKVEKKGQEKAYAILRQNALATDEELADIKTLFKLYNIQYVNDMILSFLEVLYRVLQILAMVQGKGGSSSSNN